MNDKPAGYVARLVTDSELLLNIGSIAGVRAGDYYDILDESTRDVIDPKTGETLGSIDRVKARVVVFEVAEKLALAKVTGRSMGLSSAARVLSGDLPAVTSSPDRWREGVGVGDPVRFGGRKQAGATKPGE